MTPRPMTQADWPPVQAAFAHSFTDCRPPSVWEWRYAHASEGWLGSVCPSQNGQIASFVGGARHKAWLWGKESELVVGQDSFSHPSFRAQASGRRGLFIRTEIHFFAQCAQSGIALYLGFELERKLKLGEILGTHQRYEGGQWWQMELGPSPRPPSAFAVWLDKADFSHPHWDAFWKQRQQHIQASLVRDSAFLSWRFDPRQGQTYACFAIRRISEPAPIGYMVFAVPASGPTVLVDAVFPEAPQASRAAWEQAAFWLSQKGIRRVITFFGVGCPEAAHLPFLGFAPCESPMPTAPAFHVMNPHISAEAFQKSYAFTLADSDLY
jgi:hypothetical protein